MRKGFRLIFFLLFFSWQAHGQGYIIGCIHDAETHEPLAGVNISFAQGKGTATDTYGKFFLETDTGRINLLFSYVGYAPLKKTVQISVHDTLLLNAEIRQETSSIDQIVISAGRVEQKVSELSVSMDIIKPGTIADRHILRTDELLNRSNGIEVFDGQASIRGGSGFSYGAGSRVMALVDGLPEISADAGSIRWQFLPLENLAQVEIIKGASSVLYGSSALNGVINFRSADPGPTPITGFYAETGFYGNPRNIHWKWWSTPKIFSSFSFSHLQKLKNNDIAVGASGLWDDGYRHLNDEKLGRFNIHLKHHSFKKPGLSYGVNLNVGYTAKTDFILWEDAYTGALKQQPATAEQLFSSFVTLDPFIIYKKGTTAQHELKMRVQSSVNMFIINQNNNSDARSVYTEYQYRRSLGKVLNITGGVAENFNRIISPFYGDHQSLNLSGFSQLEVIPFDRLKLSGGFRLEEYTLDGAINDLVPVFRTGLNYRLADLTFWRASFGQGYRYPSIAEKFANTSLGSVTIFPSPDIKPESGWSSEMGIKQGILTSTMNGQMDLAFFYSENSQLIEYTFGSYPDPVTAQFGYGFKATNSENSRVYGLEAEYQSAWKLGSLNMNGSLGYTYMNPVEFNRVTGKSTDVYLKYRRKHSVKLDLGTSYEKFNLGFTGMLRSPILNIDDVFTNSLSRETILPGFYDYWIHHNKTYMVLDLNVGYFLSSHYRLSLAVKNITNTEYMGRPGDMQPQRNFSLRITGSF